MAVNRGAFKKIPIYQTFLTGGDTQLILYLKNNGLICDKLDQQYRLMLSRLPGYPFPVIQFTYNTCDLNVFHLNHGSLTNRHYQDVKANVITFMDSNNIKRFDDFIYTRDDGIFEINHVFKDAFNDLLIKYFDSRDEDS